MQITRNIIKVTLEHYIAWQLKSHPPLDKWSPPQQIWFKINFDTVVDR